MRSSDGSFTKLSAGEFFAGTTSERKDLSRMPDENIINRRETGQGPEEHERVI